MFEESGVIKLKVEKQSWLKYILFNLTILFIVILAFMSSLYINFIVGVVLLFLLMLIHINVIHLYVPYKDKVFYLEWVNKKSCLLNDYINNDNLICVFSDESNLYFIDSSKICLYRRYMYELEIYSIRNKLNNIKK